MIGWLVDTNVIASLIAPNGAPSVKGWGRAVDERRLFISILTLAEYDKGIANLAGDDPNVQRYIATRDALEARFTARILSLSDPVVRRRGGHLWACETRNGSSAARHRRLACGDRDRGGPLSGFS